MSVWRDIWVRYNGWWTGFVGGSRFLDFQATSRVHHVTGAPGCLYPPHQILCRLCIRPLHTPDLGTRGKPSGGSRHKRNDFWKQADDVRASQITGFDARIGHRDRGALDWLRSESIRWSPVPDVEFRRCSGISNAFPLYAVKLSDPVRGRRISSVSNRGDN